MSRFSTTAFCVINLAALALLSSTQGGAHANAGAAAPLSASEQATAELLQGTWLQEFTRDNVRVRHLLTLEARGSFHEFVRMTAPNGQVTELRHEGTWLYDGTNLKRRYTMINDRPPSRLNVPFATFQIAFESPNQFSGADHIHGNHIDYRRIAVGAPV